MKKLLMSVVAVMSLMAMSFTTSEGKFKIVKTETGEYLTNANQLSLEDLKAIKDMTVVGAKTTNIAATKIYKDAVDTAITKHTDPTDKPKEVEQKLNEILAKY